MKTLYAFKTCNNCGRYNSRLPSKFKETDGLVYFNCTCDSTLVIQAKFIHEQLNAHDNPDPYHVMKAHIDGILLADRWLTEALIEGNETSIELYRRMKGLAIQNLETLQKTSKKAA